MKRCLPSAVGSCFHLGYIYIYIPLLVCRRRICLPIVSQCWLAHGKRRFLQELRKDKDVIFKAAYVKLPHIVTLLCSFDEIAEACGLAKI